MERDDVAALVERLEGGLEGVTPGPWATTWHNDGRHLAVGPEARTKIARINITHIDHESNARHIANCDPDTIRTLLSAIKAQAARIAELEARLDRKEPTNG